MLWLSQDKQSIPNPTAFKQCLLVMLSLPLVIGELVALSWLVQDRASYMLIDGDQTCSSPEVIAPHKYLHLSSGVYGLPWALSTMVTDN